MTRFAIYDRVETLTVLYDAGCELCIRCRDWMERQPSYVRLEFVPASSEEVAARFPGVPWKRAELVVVADDGRVWAGSAAFLLCLWALRAWREWSYRLSGPELLPLAAGFFRMVSAERRHISALFEHRPCASDHCSVPSPYR